MTETTLTPPKRRTVVRDHNVHYVRHPLSLGLFTFAGFYGAMSTDGAWQVAISAACAVMFVTYAYCMSEESRRAVDVEEQIDLSTHRPMEVTRDHPGGRTVTVGKRSYGVVLIKRIGKEAERAGWQFSQDVLKRAGAPRDMYHNTSRTQQDWQQLGYVAPRGKTFYFTERGKQFVADPTALPLPQGTNRPQ